MGSQFIGEIRLFPFAFTPEGWLRCDGTLYDVMQLQPLYALIGNTYGGVPGKTFAVPDFTGAEPDPNMRFCISWRGDWPVRP